MSLLDALFRHGGLRVLDHALAQSLRRLDPTTPDHVLAAAALASLAVSHGHAAFDPTRPRLLVDADIEWPVAQAWFADLLGSRWVTVPDAETMAASDAPLVLEDGLLYLRRYREYERRLALGLQRIAAHAPAPVDAAALAPLFGLLFPNALDRTVADDGGQARAAALALLRSLLLVTGGPGTGKTTTITRLLLLLVAQARHAGAPPPRIALAAPTGRAAERMAESLRHALTQLRGTEGIDATLCDALPVEARTLHRLLGSVPGSTRFRFGVGNPLPFDVVVIDEASMVDLPLMCKLVEAVADGARLLLIGDRDQLPSVEAGDVLAAIVDATAEGRAGTAAADGDQDGLSEADATRLAPLLGEGPPRLLALPSAGSPLSGHRARLHRGFRQSEALELAPLANAVRDGDADAAIALLRGGTCAGVHFHEDLYDPLAGATREPLLSSWRSIALADDPEAAIALAGRLRLLTALRDGPQGAAPLNARIEEALAGNHRPPYFHGRLLLITENSYRHGLFNGDIGVCLRAEGRAGEDAATVAWFAGGGDGVRGFHPAALPAHGGAFAMTVHKAQGSEFDSVWLVLPRQDVRSLSRELVYTALTRARSALHMCASDTAMRAALARHSVRVSGLARRLGASASASGE